MKSLTTGKRIAIGAGLLISALGMVGLRLDMDGSAAGPRAGSPSSSAPTTPADSDFLAEAQAHIAAREYWASATDAGLQAPNRRHDLRSHFDATGVRVHDRTGAGSAPLLGLELVGLGRGAKLSPVAAGELSHHEGRVEIARADLGLTEWFENSEQGLEQGFTLAQRPPAQATTPLSTPRAPRAQADELVVELSVSGSKASLRGEEVVLTTDAGRKLSYGKLSVVDAGGQTLAARFEVPEGDRLRIVVDDANAAYPIVIDPLLSATADAQFEANQAGAELGISVAGAGDVNGDGYEDVIVGADSYDDGDLNEGAAFVFHGGPGGTGNGDSGSFDGYLSSNQNNANFGFSVAGAGDVNGDGYDDVIVGARFYAAGQLNEGAAFVFLGSASGIASGNPVTAAAQLESNEASAELGWSVAGAGDVNGDGYADVIVGARSYAGGLVPRGAAFVFLGSASGIADGNPATAASQLESNQASAEFGYSVAGAGDVNGDGYGDVIVGARFYDAGQTNEGAAFVFMGSASGVADGNPVTASAQLESDQANANAGFSVAGAGDVNGDGYADVIVGALLYDAGQINEGSAFLFLGSASGIADGNPLSDAAQLESDQANAQLGNSVAGAGDVNGDGYGDVVVGARFYDAGQADEGAAFVFLGNALGLPANAAVQLESNQASAQLGFSVAGAGDVNGDGYADIVGGAVSYNGGQSAEGAAFVYHGGASGIADGNPSTAHAQLESNQGSAFLGLSVASAGDVNGDGYGDVIVGAYLYDAGEVNEGAAFVFVGSATGIADGTPTTAHAQLESNQASAEFGGSVASAGDVNGDGYGDVIVGASPYDAGEVNEGAAFVFLGSATGIADGTPTTAHAQLESNQAAGNLGSSVASAGDVNGDGYGDVIVGARQYDDAVEVREGAAFVFLGSAAGIADGTPTTAHAQLESNQADAYLGYSVASAGDVNGDGYGDVIVGSYLYDAGEVDEGAAFVFLGSATGIADGTPATAHAQLESNQADARLGLSVASAGDVNGDGYGDVIVGVQYYDAGQVDEGAAFVFLGSAAGIADGTPTTAHAQLESDQGFAYLGESVASAGDVNGDGYGDVIVGAVFYDAPEFNEGAAFVFLGNGAGRPTLARQRRGDGSGIPVQAEGAAYAPDRFAVELLARSPRGRERAKLEVEVCPSGKPFGDVACTRQSTSTWVDLGTSGALLNRTFSGLATNTIYSWRARALYAAYSSTQPGVTPSVRSGPWFRTQARATPGDIRTVPEPGLWVGMMAGVLALAGAQRKIMKG